MVTAKVADDEAQLLASVHLSGSEFNSGAGKIYGRLQDLKSFGTA
jgi:hypothetical protein